MKKVVNDFNITEEELLEVYKAYWKYIYDIVHNYSSDKSGPIINIKGLGKFKYKVFKTQENETKEN